VSDTRPEPRWPASLALLACAGLYVVLPNRLVIGPRWLLPVLIVLPLIPLSATKHRHPNDSPWVRQFTITLIAVITLANVASMALLVHHLLIVKVSQGRNLIYSAVSVWLTNVIVYGLWFWEIDRGGPHRRAGSAKLMPDIQFPQMENPTLAPVDWRPKFIDYLYVSLTNAAAFSPTDTMPLTPMAKSIMGVQSIVSLVTIGLIVSRAVNILPA